MKEKASPFLGMAFIPFLLLGSEMLILLIESLFYGTTNYMEMVEIKGIFAPLIHWGLTCIVWGTGAWFLSVLAKKKGFDVFEDKSNAPVRNWIIVAILLVLTIVASYYAWDMHFKPISELEGMKLTFGSQGIIAFVAQYAYYLVESILFLAVIVLGQKFGELAFKKANIPWGGIFCGLTWGLGHILTQDFLTGIYSMTLAVVYGVVYLLLKKNVRYTYPVLALMFML